MKLGLAAVTGTMLLLSAVMAQAQIVNGGFESPIIMGLTATFSGPGITGWSVDSGSVDLVNKAFFAAFEGNQSLDLDGSGPGTISQQLTTVAGQQYSLAFRYSNNPIPPNALAMANVLINGNVIGLLSHGNAVQGPGMGAPPGQGNSVSDMNYLLFSSLFTATGPTTKLSFASLDPANQPNGIVLDAITVTANGPVTATPEFGSVFSLAGLLTAGGVGLWIKRRRTK